MTGLPALVHALEEHGLLLASDPLHPSAAGIVAGQAVRGSWWPHPKGRAIFAALDALDDHPDATSAKLLAGKVTFVHRRLWGALAGAGGAREPWQLRGLPPPAARLLDQAEGQGGLRLDALPAAQRRGAAEAAKVLEARLLLHAHPEHTATGAHAKRLTPWPRWAEARGVAPLAPAEARKLLEGAAAWLGPARPRLPWEVSAARRRPA